ncbi:6-phosphogluconolactonase protein [Stemphylium lycopersici]|uniref:6-phosphogluconolactonase n=1 Tax=Stemphylium lycopersici TaxID=183478 RepID=A0A364MXY4_STELY|nr:6-phosphogluconolactonase protein [Stemphylium lycopersici]
MGKPPNLYAFQTAAELAPSLRTYVLDAQNAALERHQVFRVAVSGGSLPKTLAQALLRETNGEGKVQFDKWEIFYADERAVPLDHEDSNHKLVKEELLDKIPSELGTPKVYPIDVKYLDDVQELADQYEKTLVSVFAARDSVKLPLFDLLLLGCGPDGHTCSLFPGSDLLRETEAWVLPISDSPKPPPKRITISLPVAQHGLKIAFVATGGGKKDIMRQIFDTDEGQQLPCGLVNHKGAERNVGAVTPAEGGQDATPRNVNDVARPFLNRPQSYQGDAEGGKPRSFLILPEPSDLDAEAEDMARSSIEAQNTPSVAPSTQEAPTTDAATGRLRPRSMYQHGTKSSQRTDHSEKTSLRSMRPPAPVSKPTEPQAVGLGRSQSLRRPGSTSQAAQPSTLASHARTQSTSTISATRRDAVKPNTGSERPKSLLVAPSRSSKVNSTSANTLPSTARTSTRTAGLGRAASTRAKPEASVGVGSSGAAAKSEEPLATQSKRKELATDEPRKANRPAFSTLQQHFTPRKTGKAPTATFINPAPQPVSHSLPPEIASLQAELLQLHLLHQSSEKVSRLWEESAKRTLHTKFDEVASLYQVMLKNERAGQEQKNIQSLLEWSTGGSTANLAEHVQILSKPLHELPSLVEPGGRLQRLVADFEQWMQWVQDIRLARQSHGGNNKTLGTIEGLEDSWKAENAALTRKLTAFARDLERLASPTPGSSIASIVDACTTILLGVLDELQTMQKIEAEIVTREKGWVEERLRTIARDVGTPLVVAGGEAAAWRE